MDDSENVPPEDSTRPGSLLLDGIENIQHGDLLSSILHNLLTGIVVIDQEGVIQLVNKAILELTNYSEEELLGQKINILMGAREAHKHDKYIQNFFEKGENDIVGMRRRLEVYGKERDIFTAQISVTKMEVADTVLFIGSIYDVTEQVRQEEKNWQLSRFTEENLNPVMRVNIQGNVVYANPRCGLIFQQWHTQLNGVVPEEIKKIVFKCVMHGESETTELVCNAKAQDQDQGVYYELFILPIYGLNEVYIYGTDITQAKKDHIDLLAHRTMLEAMVESQTKEAMMARHEAEKANRAKSLFLANMSHEIRTPLASIIGYAETLLEDEPNEQIWKKSINNMIASSHHLKDMINDVLDLSKIEAGKMELEYIPTSLCELIHDIESVMQPIAEEKHLLFNVNVNFPVPKSIQTDPVRLKQIILNLCSNAIKFTSQGSVSVNVSYKEQEKLLAIEVVDTGIGMTKQQMRHIFDTFVQADSSTSRQFGGTGLGLSLSRYLSEMLGGRLLVKSKPESGSRFALVLAIKGEIEPELLTEAPELSETSPDTTSMTIGQLQGNVLLAEDTAALRELIVRYVQKTGLTITAVSNGELAVRAAMQNDYDLILMDIQMPIMDGYTAIETLKSKGIDSPVVAITANALREDVDHCYALGCKDVLNKPIDRTELVKVMARFTRQLDDTSVETLTSSLYETDPEMMGLVKIFLETLPNYLRQCHEAMLNQQLDGLAHVLHTLKGMGGSYGFQIITDTAAAAEAHLKEHGLTHDMQHYLDRLDELNVMAQKDYANKASSASM